MTSALEEARDLFTEAGLAFPPIPAALTPEFRRMHEWCYASRDVNAFEMYTGHHYPHEVVTRPCEDYVAVSHAGHGINSHSLNYHLVYGWIALFVQVAWGGVYHDHRLQAEKIAAWFATCGGVLEAADLLGTRPPGDPGRLVVVQSDFRDVNACRWFGEPIGDTEAGSWLREPDRAEVPALDAALTWLNARRLAQDGQ